MQSSETWLKDFQGICLTSEALPVQLTAPSWTVKNTFFDCGADLGAEDPEQPSPGAKANYNSYLRDSRDHISRRYVQTLGEFACDISPQNSQDPNSQFDGSASDVFMKAIHSLDLQDAQYSIPSKESDSVSTKTWLDDSLGECLPSCDPPIVFTVPSWTVKNTFVECGADLDAEDPEQPSLGTKANYNSDPRDARDYNALKILRSLEGSVHDLSREVSQDAHSSSWSSKSDSISDGPLPSIGSWGHSAGTCKPCAWFWRPCSCSKGVDFKRSISWKVTT